MKDLISGLKIDQVLKPQTIQAAPLGSGNIDMRGFDSLLCVVSIGDIADALNGTSAKLEIKVEHSDDDGAGAPASYAACEAGDLLLDAGYDTVTNGIIKTLADNNGGANDDDATRYAFGYIGDKRWVKVTLTPTLATGGAVAITVIKGHPSIAPVKNDHSVQ